MTRTSGSQPLSTSAWINARVANATRSPLGILLVGCAVFVAALVVLVVVPRQARRGQRLPRVVETRPDTLKLIRALQQIRGVVDSLDVEIAAAADTLATLRAATRDTLPIELRLRRDSLASQVATLNRLLERATSAPLPASYRALAQAPPLRGNPRAAALVDTLTAVEREREDFGASGGVDPIFVALTERVSSLGRAIADIAEAERTRMRDELTALRQLQPRRDTLPASIFMTLAIAERDSVVRQLSAADSVLRISRQAHLASDSALEARRKASNVGVPPVAMLLASALLGVFAGFATALAREMHRPRIATLEEAESTAGVRVLAVIGDHERRRNPSARDRALPAHIALHAEGYRRLYLHLTGVRASLAMVTVTADDPAIAAVVSANIAASAGHEGRGTLIVDADVAHSPVAAILRAAEEPGLVEIAKGSASWPEALQALVLAHDLNLDLIPGGRRESSDMTDAEADRIRRDLARMARRYDVMVLNAPLKHVLRGARSILPAPDILLCVQLGHTRLLNLTQTVRALRASGTRVAGLVMWDASEPTIPPAHPAAERRRRREAASQQTAV